MFNVLKARQEGMRLMHGKDWVKLRTLYYHIAFIAFIALIALNLI